MPNIDKLNGVTATDITSVDNHNASAIASINGQDLVTSTLLLDLYGANVAAAYSLRKLSASYSGAAIRVRESVFNTEQDIGFDSNGDLDEAALAFFTSYPGMNGLIVKWYDQSGNGNNAVQLSTAGQPYIVLNNVIQKHNGKPAVVQDTNLGNPSNQFLELTSTISAVHKFITFYQPAAGGGRAYYAESASKALKLDGFRIDYEDGVNPKLDGVANIRTDYVLSEVKSLSGTVTSIINGSTDVSGTSTTLNIEALMGYPTSGGGIIAFMQEMIFFNADKSSDASAISTDINTYYSIY